MNPLDSIPGTLIAGVVLTIILVAIVGAIAPDVSLIPGGISDNIPGM
ncbi:MAG: hypothetical protein HY940_06610 [Gammaproteobacteria bacterium]|nr:hypothetical protein [Gammaproteobacteria bacterium]